MNAANLFCPTIDEAAFAVPAPTAQISTDKTVNNRNGTAEHQ